MKSHSSKAPRKSFDVTKMSGPDIAAEMARHTAEFKSGRKLSGPAAAHKEASASAPQPRQSHPANHPFLRASLAAEGGPSPAPSNSRDVGFEMEPRLTAGSEGGKSGLAFLQRGPRHDRWPEDTERPPSQYSRGRSSYRSGLMAGAGLALIVMATASAALWKTGDLPAFLDAHLPEAALSTVLANGERAAKTIASPDEAAIKAPPAVLAQPAPTPPTPIVLMVAPAPPPTAVPTLSVDTLSAITSLQPEAPAVELTERDNFHPMMSDHGGTGPAVPPQQMAAPAADRPARSPLTNSTLSTLKQLAERPSLKPDLDVGHVTGLEAMTATAAGNDEATVDRQRATPDVASRKPFIPMAASPLPLVSHGNKAARSAEPPQAAGAGHNAKPATAEISAPPTLSPLPPPITIRSAAGKVSNIAGAASVDITEQPADGDKHAARSRSHPRSHDRRDPSSETDAGGDGGLGVAGAQPDGASTSGRGGGHSGSPSGGDNGGGTSGGGTDPGSGTSGDGGSGGSGGTGGDDGGGTGGGSSGGDGGGSGDGGNGSGSDGGGGDGGGGD